MDTTDLIVDVIATVLVAGAIVVAVKTATKETTQSRSLLYNMNDEERKSYFLQLIDLNKTNKKAALNQMYLMSMSERDEFLMFIQKQKMKNEVLHEIMHTQVKLIGQILDEKTNSCEEKKDNSKKPTVKKLTVKK